MRAPVPSRTDPNAPPRPDLLDDARVTLLITDGMEVASGGAGNSSCAAGADPTCIRMLLEQRIGASYRHVLAKQFAALLPCATAPERWT
jgi:hypothetical protein